MRLDYVQDSTLFIRNDLMAPPVVDNLEQREPVGVVRRHEISNAYVRRVHVPQSVEN